MFILYIVILCSNFLNIKSEENPNITVHIAPNNCTIDGAYKLIDGLSANLFIDAPQYINHGWWRINSSKGFEDFKSNLKTENSKLGTSILYTYLFDKSMAGEWEFTFYYLIDNDQFNSTKIFYQGHNYTQSVCRTKVGIAPSEAKSNNKLFIILASVIGAVQTSIIIAQAVYIVHLRAKARELLQQNTHNNLSKKAESAGNDTARYCSNPGQKMMKAPSQDNDNRDSVIYEAPNIELLGGRMPMQPPQPPAITTMPRTPRPDHNAKISQERETSVANRPPLPLPPQGHPHNMISQEVYEEMDNTDENTYEAPPIINTLPVFIKLESRLRLIGRQPVPPKKLPTNITLNVKENALKPRLGNKPVVTPKPLRSNAVSPVNEIEQAFSRRRNNADKTNNLDETLRRRNNADKINELEETLRRRNNGDARSNELEEALKRRKNAAMPVPIKQIPEPSRTSPNKPPPAIKKPKIQPPVQEEIYYNENQASSDEEWTYEPLKPLNSYDPNIYNV